MVFALLGARLVSLQVTQHDVLAKEAAEFHSRKEVIPAKRGKIIDRNGELLARNQSVYTLYADRYHLNDKNIALRALSRAKAMPIRDIRATHSESQILASYKKFVAAALSVPAATFTGKRAEITIARNIEEDRRRAITQILDEARIGGVYLRKETRRFYPSTNRATHVIGYVNSESYGREGVERSMDHVLRGADGYRYLEKDRSGREIAAYRGEQIEPIDGNQVRLTLDMGIQNIVERELESAVAKYRPEKITAIFMAPKTGDILALANRPHFDLSTRQGNRRNFAVQDQYEPGSTFKLVSLSSALNEDVVTPDTAIFCHFGEMQEPDYVVSDHHSYGDLTVSQVMAKSSNIGAFQIVRAIGKNRYHHYMRRFGFGETTGVQLSGESAGQIHAPETWSNTSFSRMAMGYEVGVTPLQMLTALSIIANEGQLIQPRVVLSVEDESGRKTRSDHPQFVRQVLQARTAAAVRDTLVAVTSKGGTGTSGALPNFAVAGKTGTARKYSSKEKQYLEGRYIVSFMGFFPAEKPEIMGIVVIDDPKAPAGQLYGGSLAAPVFREMSRQVVAYLGIQPETSPHDYAHNVSPPPWN